jgi:DNA-binding CsgD family transcriptional regulator
MAEQLVGRRQELAAIDVFLEGEGAGPAALLLEGDAGIGKTLLWREGVERARTRGFRTLVATPAGAEVRLSFAGLGDLLGAVAAEALPSLPGPQRRALEVALLLAEADETPETRAIALGLVEVLRAVAGTGRVILAVDDLQWLDAPSGEVLAFALRRLDGEPLRLLVAMRSALGGGVPFELDRAFGDARLQRLRLGPLSLGAVYELVRTRLGLTLDRATLIRLHEASAGNPFFALEIGRELRRRGLELSPDQPLPLPGDLLVLLRERLGRLPARTRTLLLIAAALSRPTVGLLEAAVGSPEEVAADLEQALQAGVIELKGEQLRFTHPLLASVCYAQPARRRRQTHARLAQIVDDPEARARHLALAAEGDDEQVAQALDEAAKHAATRGAPQTAAELWEMAARFTPEERGEDRRRRRVATAESLLWAGDLTGARSLFEQLVAETPAGAERGALLLQLAMTRDDDLAAIATLCEQALKESDSNDALASQAHRLLALALLGEGQIRRGLAHAREAVRFAETAGESVLLGVALAFAAQLENLAGEFTPGLLDRALALEQGLEGLRPSYEHPSTTLGCWLMYQDRLDEARTMLDRQLAKATVTGEDLTRSGLLLHLTELECRAGNWHRADELASECCELFERRGLELQGSVALYVRSLVDAHLGRVAECRAAGEQGLPIAETAGDAIFTWQLHGVLGFLELSLGNLDAAAQHLRDVPAQLVALGWNEPTVYPVWPNAIEALIGLGKLAQARAYLEQYEERAQAFGSPWALATAARCRGLLAAADGELESAREAFRRALVEHERTGPFERGRTLLALGLLERRAKQKRAARDAIQQALAIFEKLGARLWADRARAELARIGGRAKSADELTPAERRVAELVAEGQTNREVAAALIVSEHTVESHLRRIYRKLGVRSRAELARRLPEPTRAPVR